MAETFHGRDPDRVATSAICELSPTRCQARTRLYADGHFEAVQSLDDAVEVLEDQLFADVPQDLTVQRSFELRKSPVLLRRIVLPMREMVNALMRPDLRRDWL